jgi:hypothetical protein
MKPMIFSSEPAFSQLDVQGKVWSARTSPREEGEKVWIRASRTGKKMFEAKVTEVRKKTEPLDKQDMFRMYYDLSGFDTPDDWEQEVINHHGSMPYALYFHKVEKIEGDAK